MRTMFVKLFFWFLLATILSGVVFFLLAFNLRLGPTRDELMRHFDSERNQILSQALTVYGRTVAAAREREGNKTDFIGTQPGAMAGMRAYLFTGDGTPLSEGVTPSVRDAVRRAVAAGENEPLASGVRDVVVVKVRSPSGKPYLAATAVTPELPSRESLQDFSFPPGVVAAAPDHLCDQRAGLLRTILAHYRSDTEAACRDTRACPRRARHAGGGERRKVGRRADRPGAGLQTLWP